MKALVKFLGTSCVIASLLFSSVSSASNYSGYKQKTDNIKIMSRNIYLGADLFPVLAAAQSPDPTAVPLAVSSVFQ